MLHLRAQSSLPRLCRYLPQLVLPRQPKPPRQPASPHYPSLSQHLISTGHSPLTGVLSVQDYPNELLPEGPVNVIPAGFTGAAAGGPNQEDGGALWFGVRDWEWRGSSYGRGGESCQNEGVEWSKHDCDCGYVGEDHAFIRYFQALLVNLTIATHYVSLVR
ncbi:hypothetical protein E6O75_ATG05516 [Venturia nashicola]|uniref:Uncharacterized protein n=1 Tax=Venturia nashicola TaxID=86259 RepID=A0A4Z1PFM0_9PEZI|nr:hypothetical protein E6O75_ATG05516 [Venturia nashicola]